MLSTEGRPSEGLMRAFPDGVRATSGQKGGHLATLVRVGRLPAGASW